MEGGIHLEDATGFKDCLFLARNNPYILRLAFSAEIGGLLFGYDTGPLSFSLSLFWMCMFFGKFTHVLGVERGVQELFQVLSFDFKVVDRQTVLQVRVGLNFYFTWLYLFVLSGVSLCNV